MQSIFHHSFRAVFHRCQRMKKHALGRTMPAILATSLLLAVLPWHSSEAGYLEDFYESASGQVASTPAGLYQSASLGLATGGSYSLRAPMQDLPLFQMKAPSLKAGCGGIDLFLGAISIPSREEFVSYLRSIGTAMPGLAFQLALQSLSPDLNEQVAAYRDLIRTYTKDFSDSCTAAQSIFDATGASGALTEAGYYATNHLLHTGEASDAGEADDLVRTNGAKRIASVPDRTDTNGNFVDGAEVNLTWSLLPGGSSGLERDLRELMMTMVGTRIYRKSGTGRDTVLSAVELPPQDLTVSFITGTDSSGLKRKFYAYRCDEVKKCLKPELVVIEDVDLTTRVEKLLEGYVRAIRNRTETVPSEDDLAAMAGMTSLPVLRIAELAAHPKFAQVGDSMVHTYSEIVAWEIVLRAVRHLTTEVERAVQASAGRGASARNDDHARTVLARLEVVRADVAAQEGAMLQRLTAAGNFAASLEHIERSLYGNAAVRMVAGFGNTLTR